MSDTGFVLPGVTEPPTATAAPSPWIRVATTCLIRPSSPSRPAHSISWGRQHR